MEALLIVDMQNDFMPEGALAVADSDALIPYINALMQQYPFVVASLDYHPKHHVSFASTHKRKVGDVIEIGGIVQHLWPDHCIQGTFGAHFHPGLNQSAIDMVVQKGCDPNIDSYSAFFDNQHQKATGLDLLLKKAGVDSVAIVGVATDYCVKFTALDALKLGYQVTLLTKGCKGVDIHPKDSLLAIEAMRQKGALIR